MKTKTFDCVILSLGSSEITGGEWELRTAKDCPSEIVDIVLQRASWLLGFSCGSWATGCYVYANHWLTIKALVAFPFNKRFHPGLRLNREAWRAGWTAAIRGKDWFKGPFAGYAVEVDLA